MVIAVDTGGTKTLVSAFDEDGKIVSSIKFPTPRDPDIYLHDLCETILEDYGLSTIDALVVGVPGIVRDGVAVWCKNLGWKNFAVQKKLQAVFKTIPVLVENDANLGGLAETRMLATIPGLSLYMTVSTGIGTGIISDGRIESTLRFSEGGHMLVEFDGSVRLWESFASGKAIHEAYGQYARDITSKRTWHQIADRISRGLLATIPLLQPDVIIIGGSIGTYFDHYQADLTGLLRDHLPDHIPVPVIQQAQHPEEAVVYGCYYYALDNLVA